MSDDLEGNNNTNLILLEGKQPGYIVDLFIQAALYKHFDINKINPNDIHHLVQLIDQYPLDSLTVNKIEFELIDYFRKYSIKYDQWMKNICTRYQLRFMYMDIHNNNIIS